MNGRRSLEIKVGLFTLFGIILTCYLAIYFGRLADPLKKSYRITVHFANASGLLKGAQVLMGGATIGEVARRPEIPPDQDGVNVTLSINSSVKIPAGSQFAIRSSGLLGDAYVDVVPPNLEESLTEEEEMLRLIPAAGSSHFALNRSLTITHLRPGLTVDSSDGGSEGPAGIEGLLASGDDFLSGLQTTNSQIQGILVKVDKELLTDRFMSDLHASAENVSSLTERLDGAAEELLPEIRIVITNLKEITERLKAVTESFQSTAGTLQADSRKLGQVLQSANSLIEDLSQLITKLTNGEGVFASLLNDDELNEDLAETITFLRAASENIKEHGILFYRDTAGKEEDKRTKRSTFSHGRGSNPGPGRPVR